MPGGDISVMTGFHVDDHWQCRLYGDVTGWSFPDVSVDLFGNIHSRRHILYIT